MQNVNIRSYPRIFGGSVDDVKIVRCLRLVLLVAVFVRRRIVVADSLAAKLHRETDPLNGHSPFSLGTKRRWRMRKCAY